jgi:hypothetical protein
MQSELRLLNLAHGLITFLLFLSALSSELAMAEMTEGDRAALAEFQKVRAKGRTLEGLLGALKGRLSPEDLEFLNQKLLTVRDQAAPTFTLHGRDTILVQVEKKVFPLKIVSARDQKFSFNNHSIDLSTAKTPEERFELFLKALPASSQTTAFSNLLLPRAHANPLYVYLASAAGGALMSYYFSNEDQCKEIGASIDSCGKQRRKIRNFFAKKEQGDEALSAKKKRSSAKKKTKSDDDEEDEKDWDDLKKMKLKGECPIESIDEELDNDTADLISEMSRAIETTKYRLAYCRDDRKLRALACERDLAKLSKEWCLNLSVNMALRLSVLPSTGESPPVEKGNVSQ